MAEGAVTAWRLAAGPDSVEQFVGARRATVGQWTADTHGRMRRGDVVLLYGTETLQCYAAVARVASDPVENSRAQRLKKNRRWWVWLQIQPLQKVIPRHDVEVKRFAEGERSGLKRPQGASAHLVSPDAIEGFLGFLGTRDEVAARKLEEWLDGRGRYPRDIDEDELRDADWSPPQRRTPIELQLSRDIAAKLNRQKGLRYLTEQEAQFSRRGDDPARFSREHPMVDHEGPGRADIVMVDERREKPTLIVIEVKIKASLAMGRNPLKVANYADALAKAYGRSWAVRPVIVAQHFAPSLLREAAKAKIEHRTVNSAGKLQGPPL